MAKAEQLYKEEVAREAREASTPSDSTASISQEQMQALRDAARNELCDEASSFVSTLHRVVLNQARTNASGAISPPTPFQRPLERPVARSLIEDLTSDAGNDDEDAKGTTPSEGFPARTVQIQGHEQLQQDISNLSVLVASQMDIPSYHFGMFKVPQCETS